MEKRRIQELKRRDRSAIRILLIITIAFSGAWMLSTYILGMYYIPSPSMETTLKVNDRVVVNKIAKNFTPIQRGDIIVFKDPGGWLGEEQASSGDTLIKRVIGVGGDTVECAGDGSPIMVNGVAVYEPYINSGQNPSNDAFSVIVPEETFFVMGDNREQSFDSRYQNVQFIPFDNIVGVMFMKM